ncbi:fungal specific transcription factor [Hirsutella rhossiliensis]
MLAVSMGFFFKSTDFDEPPTHRDFADEAFRLFASQDHAAQLPLLQGIAIMSIYEQAFGDPLRGVSLFFDTLYTLRSTSEILDVPLSYDNYGSPRANKLQQAIAFISNGFHYLDVKMELIVAPATPPSRIPWINSIRDEVRCQKGEMIDALWIPHPISTQPQLSYYNDALEAEHELSWLAREILPAIKDNRLSPVPDYLGAKILYRRLLQWKESKSQRFQGQTSVVPAWVCLMASYHVVSIKLLEPFTGLSFLEFGGGKTARFLSQSHSEGMP